jgi:hypothetical protein
MYVAAQRERDTPNAVACRVANCVRRIGRSRVVPYIACTHYIKDGDT